MLQMRSASWRPLTILLLGLLAVFGVPVGRAVLGDAIPGLWIQIPAAAGAVLLLVQEWRGRTGAGRWRLLAWLGGLLALAWVAGVAILWLIWPK